MHAAVALNRQVAALAITGCGAYAEKKTVVCSTHRNGGTTMLLSIAKCSFVALTVLTAAAQFFFMYAEMRRWPKVAKLLTKMSDECVKESEPLGANMGLYNGFLALGLVWSLLAQYLFGTQLTHDLFGVLLALFFLGCVLTAAAYGAYSVSPLLLPMQGSWPFLALIALSIFWWLSPAAAVK